jgi:hypothetical protein
VSFDPFRPKPLPVSWDVVRAPAAPRDCFADEIAIDFPSMAHMVDRIRTAFLEDHPPAELLSTELPLSTGEARRGLVVPLDVPMRGTCGVCGGHGETWTGSCEPCGGTGDALVHHPVRVSVPPGVSDGSRVRFRVTAPDASSVRVELRVAIRSSAA